LTLGEALNAPVTRPSPGGAGFFHAQSPEPIQAGAFSFSEGRKMDLQDRLEKAWADEGRYRDTHRTLTFTKRGLEIGNGTVVAKYTRDDWNRRILCIDGQEERILALLSVA